MADNIHSGHRSKMRKKFLLDGIDSLETHEALELLLYYAVPYKDVNPLAHHLLDNFGSISAIFDAPIDMLMASGVTENQAIFLKLIPDMTRLYYESRYQNDDKIIDFENLQDRIKPKFIGRVNETVVLLLIDAKGKELFSGVISKGSLNASEIPVKKIIDLCIRFNASSAVIAHNHPNGVALPSISDLEITADLRNALLLIGVNLLDHYIVADEDFVSLAQSEFGNGIFYSKDE